MQHNGPILSKYFPSYNERLREIRIYLFAQATSNTTEAVITQMVQSRLKPVRLARGNERREHSRRKMILGGGEYYGGSHKLLHTFSK